MTTHADSHPPLPAALIDSVPAGTLYNVACRLRLLSMFHDDLMPDEQAADGLRNALTECAYAINGVMRIFEAENDAARL